MQMNFMSFPIPLVATLLVALIAACGGSPDTRTADARADSSSRADAPPAARKALSPGRSDTAGCARSYTGTIGADIGIAMSLCRTGDTLAGTYRYLKVGKDIELQGHVEENGEFILYEWGNEKSRRQTGHWLGRFIGDSLMEGTWNDPQATRVLPFRVALAGSTAAAPATGFSGGWLYRKDGYSFSLVLRQQGKSIVGHHCAVTKNATRLDCSSDEETDRGLAEPDGSFSKPSITGTVEGNVATVRFESAYGVDSLMNPITGTATMRLHDGTIDWKITDFTPGDFYLPMEATLRRSMHEGK